jgi:hypothetical protein
MAKQKGIIKIEGTMGDITFFKTADGYLAREKTTVSAERIKSDPAFQRTRENGAEFGRAGAAGKLLRHAIRNTLQTAKDRRVVSRLTREMVRVIQADTTSVRGKRNVIDGEAELLTGFDCNAAAHLGASLYAPYTATIDRTSGALSVVIPAFTPATSIVAPAGATHFRITAVGTVINFEAGSYDTDTQETAHLPLGSTPTAPISLALSVPAGSTHPIFLLLGIQFTQQVNSVFYPLKNGTFNALQIVKVSGL